MHCIPILYSVYFLNTQRSTAKMKTNQLMKIAFSNGEIEVFHKTSMGNLTQVWSCGNVSRMQDGKSAANMSRFLDSASTKEFMGELEKQGVTAFEVTGRGNKKRTWACIELMVYAAQHLSVSFHLEVIQSFIKSKILEFRDESGDAYKSMNIAIDSYLPNREGKNNLGVRIQIAQQIKRKVNPDLVSWNFATADELRHRIDLEDKIEFSLEAGFITGFPHLKQVIARMK